MGIGYAECSSQWFFIVSMGNEGGSGDGASLSEEAPWRGPSGGAPSLGTLEDMLGKSLNAGISPRGGPFLSERNLVCGGGL